jgi:hypothetical protein
MEIHEDLARITEANTGKPPAVLNSVDNTSILCCLMSHLNTNYSLQSYCAIENQGAPEMLALGLV